MSEPARVIRTPIRSEKGDILGHAVGTELRADEAMKFISERFTAMQGVAEPDLIVVPPPVLKAVSKAV